MMTRKHLWTQFHSTGRTSIPLILFDPTINAKITKIGKVDLRGEEKKHQQLL